MIIVISIKYISVNLSLAECSNMFRHDLNGMAKFNQTFNRVMDRF